ncbi:MAG TPA: hypothetical protein VH187_05475 [Scandinavium sp.]|jgi:uncharacterized protein YdcH (DUF465 family)|uniref:hypothetical protein n=1 Tax=Scandinavium sp. TaxID=2830653 RepID=UPI002E2ED4CF|nr:hypothetical protein [Scandinavium sp.]HEX4500611.1 hypothetical protein [Scandinavium sp.]
MTNGEQRSDLKGEAAIFERLWRASEKECAELRDEISRLKAELSNAMRTLKQKP